MLTTKTIQKLKFLSRIKINKKEEKELMKQLQKILEFFNTIKNVKTKDDVELSVNLLRNKLRGDKEEGSYFFDREIITKNTPNKENSFYKVPPILEK